MAPSTISGALPDLERSLRRLEQSPDALERERRRFDQPPPAYESTPSPGSTLLDDPDDDGVEPAESPHPYKVDHYATRAWSQFHDQVDTEMRRLWKADPYGHFWPTMPGGVYEEPARKTVKDNWRLQGIWDDLWDTQVGWWEWKHERFPVGEDASRPFAQFLHQMAHDRQEILATASDSTVPVTINTLAYERRKQKWMGWRIWDEQWGLLPGLSWAHEEPAQREQLLDAAMNRPDGSVHGNETPSLEEAAAPRNFLGLSSHRDRVAKSGTAAPSDKKAKTKRGRKKTTTTDVDDCNLGIPRKRGKRSSTEEADPSGFGAFLAAAQRAAHPELFPPSDEKPKEKRKPRTAAAKVVKKGRPPPKAKESSKPASRAPPVRRSARIRERA